MIEPDPVTTLVAMAGEQLGDWVQVVEATTTTAWPADRREWPQPALFAEQVRLDCTSLLGGAPITSRCHGG
jgi:hypothetical protein